MTKVRPDLKESKEEEDDAQEEEEGSAGVYRSASATAAAAAASVNDDNEKNDYQQQRVDASTHAFALPPMMAMMTTPLQPPLDERKPAAVSSKHLQQNDGEGDDEKAMYRTSVISVASARFQASDANNISLPPFLSMMMMMEPTEAVISQKSLSKTHDEPADPHHDIESAIDDVAMMEADEVPSSPIPVRGARNYTNNNEKAAYVLPPPASPAAATTTVLPPVTTATTRGRRGGRRVQPRAMVPGAEYVRVRAPGMRPAWYEERRQTISGDDSQRAEDDFHHHHHGGEEGDSPPPSPTSTTAGRDSPLTILQATAIERPTTTVTTLQDSSSSQSSSSPLASQSLAPINANVATARCTSLAHPFTTSTTETQFSLEAPINDPFVPMIPKPQYHRNCVLAATYGCGLVLGIGIGLIVWTIYEQTQS